RITSSPNHARRPAGRDTNASLMATTVRAGRAASQPLVWVHLAGIGTASDVLLTIAVMKPESLGVFLKTRRDRVTPVDVGLRTYGTARRVPGLRREEL